MARRRSAGSGRAAAILGAFGLVRVDICHARIAAQQDGWLPARGELDHADALADLTDLERDFVLAMAYDDDEHGSVIGLVERYFGR